MQGLWGLAGVLQDWVLLFSSLASPRGRQALSSSPQGPLLPFVFSPM